LRSEITAAIQKLSMHFLAEIDRPLGYFNSRFGQSFSVLTCCRMLHTVQTGVVASKFSAVQWAERALGREWQELIRNAWDERKGVRFGEKIRQLAEPETLAETARFISYSQMKCP
jgi:Domain of unknown function (DUF4111)